MPRYLVQAAYTPEAWSALIKQPQNRLEAIGELLRSLGGRFESVYASMICAGYSPTGSSFQSFPSSFSGSNASGNSIDIFHPFLGCVAVETTDSGGKYEASAS